MLCTLRHTNLVLDNNTPSQPFSILIRKRSQYTSHYYSNSVKLNYVEVFLNAVILSFLLTIRFDTPLMIKITFIRPTHVYL